MARAKPQEKFEPNMEAVNKALDDVIFHLKSEDKLVSLILGNLKLTLSLLENTELEYTRYWIEKAIESLRVSDFRPLAGRKT